ncbi:MAG: hypothetical protein H0V80_17385 [Acidobacteria bacterium]|nr:hypothetical protein [Acidobacteriota bacterium]
MTRGCQGVTLPDLLVSVCVGLVTVTAVVAALPPILDVVQTIPESTDLDQRARGASEAVVHTLKPAGAGPDLLGLGPLPHFVPAVWPLRLGTATADPPATAWGDRLSTLRVAAGAAQAPLAVAVVAGTSTIVLAWHPACGLDVSCGFRRGDLVLVFNQHGVFELATLTGVAGLSLTRAGAASQPVDLPGQVTAVSASVVLFDAVRRQLRLADGATGNQPLVDDVVGVRVRYYGSAAPPRWPAVSGADTCAVSADGTPRLGLRGPVPGPPIELALAELSDGPWCGAGAGRFDADLMRVRAVRFAIRLQASSAAVRGPMPAWFTWPGSAVRPGQQVRDRELDLFVTPPNLAWTP